MPEAGGDARRRTDDRIVRTPSRLVPSLLVAAAALAASASTLQGTFVYDDFANVVQNEWIRNPGALHRAFTEHVAAFDPEFRTSYYRPLMHVFYAATYVAFGLRPWAFHLVNVVLHVLSCLLVLRVAGHLVSRSGSVAADRVAFGATAAALVFATHPVHVEAVAWIAGLTDLSSTFFVLLALTAYPWNAGRAEPSRLALSAGSYFLATLSKEPAFLMPLLVVVIEVGAPPAGQRLGRQEFLRRLTPFSLAAIAYLGLRWNALHGWAPAVRPLQLGAEASVGSALWLVAEYLRLLVAPIGLNALHPFEPVWSLAEPRAIAGMFAMACLAAPWLVPGVPRLVRLATAIVVVPLLPAFYIPALGEGVVAERYLYLPVLGVGLLVGWLFAKIPATAVRTMALGLIVVVAAAASIARCAVWRDSLALWSDTVRASPGSAVAREYLCYALLEDQRPAEAERRCREALSLDPRRDAAVVNLAAALSAQGKLDEALVAYGEALARTPDSPQALTGQGLVYMAKGRPDLALQSYRAAIAADPGDAEAHNCLAVALVRLGRPDEALTHLQRAVREAPDHPDYRANLRALESQLAGR